VAVALWFGRRRTHRQLRHLDFRLPADAGLDERERPRECANWRWQDVPENMDVGARSNENARRLHARVRFDETENPDQTLRRNRTTTSTRAIS
jgi:uncharacterized protein YjiS (DUF1127 family)